MQTETINAAIAALEAANLDTLFTKAIAVPEELEDGDTTDIYPLMFNVESNELFFLEYAVNNNGWNKTAEQQNPWITLGWVSANDIIMGDPVGEITDKLNLELEIKSSF